MCEWYYFTKNGYEIENFIVILVMLFSKRMMVNKNSINFQGKKNMLADTNLINGLFDGWVILF